jgi:murein L,D-transpeptidase YafK
MLLFRDGQEWCRYRIALGRSPCGAKARAGDHKTPEGRYILDSKNPNSSFYRAIRVSYPLPADRERAAREGVDPGGLIMVHGIKSGLGWLGRLHRMVDWTAGCIALTDAEMDQFYSLVPQGTLIEIRP